MNKYSSALLGITTLVMLWSSVGAARAETADRIAVMTVTERWACAYEKGDLEAIAEMYTEDAKMMPEGSEAISGRSASR